MFSPLILSEKLLFFIILLFCLESEVLMFFPSIDDIYFILILLYFIFTFYSYFIVKPHEAQMFQCKGQLLLVNLLKHKCYGAEVIYLSLVLRCKTELCPRCVVDFTCQ